MVVRNADADARPVRMNFTGIVRRVKAVYTILAHPPEGVSILDSLERLKKF